MKGHRTVVFAVGLLGALALVVPRTSGLGAGDPLPRNEAKEPAEALKTFQVREGFGMHLLAAEPDVADPVAAAYDEDGRLFVAEMSDYPYVEKKNDKAFAENTDDPPIGQVRVLIDRDGDGRFDESHLVADKLSWPTGVVPWKGGVFVAATPDIWYLKDTDGDHKADVRRKVFTGFRKFNIQAVMNNLAWGLDHSIYGAASGNGGEVRTGDQPAMKPVPVLRRDFRFDPASGRFDAISGGARFGNTFDDWGNRFLCDIRNPAEHVVLPARYLERNPVLPPPRVLHDAAEAGDQVPIFRISPPEPWRELRARRWASIGKAYPRSELVAAGVLTSSSGVTVYRGDAFPPAFRGNLFLGEVANNVIHRMVVEPDGVTFRAHRAPGEEKAEFLASTDTWFRPVNFVNAPDGTLTVLDMYRETIEHPWSIPDDIKAQLDLRSGSDRGRIYRLAPPGFRSRPTPRLSRATTPELVALLEHPNAWHHDTAHRLLFERQDPAAVEPLRQFLRRSPEPLGRLHALWSLEGLKSLRDEDLLVSLQDAAAGVREHALRLAEPRLDRAGPLRDRVLALADAPEARVRFQVAFTLGEVDDPSAIDALSRIARRDAGDPWIRTAVLSSSWRKPLELWERLLAGEGDQVDPPFATSRDGLSLLRTLAFVVGARATPQEAARAIGRLPRAEDRAPPASLELAVSLADGLRRGGHVVSRMPMDGPEGIEASARLEALTRKALDLVRARDLPAHEVAAGIGWLGHRPFAEAREALVPLLSPTQAPEIQRSTARALAEHHSPEVAPLLLEHWRAYRPAIQAEILQALLGRSQWVGPLLDAVEAKTVPVGQLPMARRAQLIESPDPAIQRRARLLFGPDAPGSRRDAIARYEPSLKLASDPERGRGVFDRECILCHKLGARGNAVGPNLAGVRRRTPDELLLHILDPNREVAPDYLEYSVSLKDGRVLTGLIESEGTTGLMLKRAEGVTDAVLQQDIEAMTSTGKSLMPEGLEAKIAPQDMADLVAYLLSLQEL